MTTKAVLNSRDPLGNNAPIPMSEVFHVIGEQAVDVVQAALQHRQDASNGARSALNAAIDRSEIIIPGFRNPSRAQNDMLAEPVLFELLHGNDRLASAVLRTWAESLPALVELVTSHLGSLGTPVVHSKIDAFDDLWTDAQCMVEARLLLASGHAGFEQRDVELMLSYLSRRFPVPPVRLASPLLADFIDAYDALPPDAPEWEEAYEFLSQLSKVASAKVAQRQSALMERFDAAVAGITADFADELRYLGIDLTQASSASVGSRFIRAAIVFTDELHSALDAYREVRPQAPTRSDEVERAQQRERCEADILSLMAIWHETVENASRSENRSVDGKPEDRTGALPWETPQQAEATGSDGEDLAAENTRLKWANDALHEDRSKLQAEKQAVTVENARLSKEFSALRHAHDSLRAEKEAQGEENSTLRRQLRESRQREEAWRGTPSPALPLPENDEHSLPLVESVRDALAVAATRFPDRLVIALNSRSKEDTPFQRPDEVLGALSWLATDYHRTRCDGGGDAANLDKAIKEACPGWSYIPHQSAVTIGRFKDWYFTKVDGRKHELAEHVGRGSSGNPQHTVRIAFAWDNDAKKVVVGYVGHHQRSQGS